jgi:maltoporin
MAFGGGTVVAPASGKVLATFVYTAVAGASAFTVTFPTVSTTSYVAIATGAGLTNDLAFDTDTTQNTTTSARILSSGNTTIGDKILVTIMGV